jgi:ketosteroid isomerase-like protein
LSQENVELIERLFDEFVNRDPRLDATWEAVGTLLAPDVVYNEDPRWPGADTYCGIPALRGALTSYFDALGEMRVEAEQFFDAGECVVVFMNWWARGASGADAEMSQAAIFTVRDGTIARWQVVFDRAEALNAVVLEE